MPGIENSVRISIGTPEENDALLSALERYAADHTGAAGYTS
jgi:histidinol-phosphate/aromatic aminotransferase/cobyric acid decarboxylase-like protein